MSRPILLLLALPVLPLAAQQAAPRPVTLGPLAGVLIPTGAQRDNLKAATTLGVQAGYRLGPRWSLSATGSWTHGHHKYGFSGDRVDIWQYDAGIEFNPCGGCAGGWDLHPVLGLGLGGRTLDYKATGIGSSTCLAAYGGVGLEASGPALALRLEGRDYLSCQESPIAGEQQTRNDIRVTLGLGLRL